MDLNLVVVCGLAAVFLLATCTIGMALLDTLIDPNMKQQTISTDENDDRTS